jgi:hypothetical protein
MIQLDDKEKPRRQILTAGETIELINVEAVLVSLYLEGWNAADEGFDGVLLDKLREAGNRISQGQEREVALILANEFLKRFGK